MLLSSPGGVASPSRLCSDGGHRLGLNGFGLTFVSRCLLAIWTGVAFATILHVILVDVKGFVDFGTESVVIIDPVAN